MTIDKLRCEECDKDFVSKEAIESHNRSKHYTTKKSVYHKFPTKIVLIVGIIVLAIAGIVVAINITGHKSSNTTGVTGSLTNSDNVQIASLRVSGSQYVLEPSTFKKDIPIKIVADINNMPGCSKSVTIPAFGVLKYVSNKDNTITFTPTKAGTFRMACSMSMYTGTFIVE